MGRKFVDCREMPSEEKCSLAISADTEAELLDAAIQHAVAVHKHPDTPELRDEIRHAMKDGTPPVESRATRHKERQYQLSPRSLLRCQRFDVQTLVAAR